MAISPAEIRYLANAFRRFLRLDQESEISTMTLEVTAEDPECVSHAKLQRGEQRI